MAALTVVISPTFCFSQFLANLTCNKAAATSLVLGSALLSWVELQLHTVRPTEALAWAKVIENIVAVVDLVRLETATAGEWRAVISRCLLRLLSESGESQYARSLWLALN